MIYAAQQVVADGFGDTESAEEFLDEAEKVIFNASQYRVGKGYAHVSPMLANTFEDLEKASLRKGDITGMPSGVRELDKLTAGFQPSDLIIVAGRPAMGKTALALNVAFNGAEATEKPAIVFSLEMGKEQLVRRILSSEGRGEASKMRAPGNLNPEDWRRLMEAASVLHNVPIFLDDTSPMTPIEIRAKARRLMAEKGLGLVIVDYLQLMQWGEKKGQPGAGDTEISVPEKPRQGDQRSRHRPVPVESRGGGAAARSAP